MSRPCCSSNNAAARLPVGPKARVRLMQLAPGGGELLRHADITDRDAGVAMGRLVRLHIPLRANPACVFNAWGLEGERRRLVMPEGACCYLDQRKPHTAVNGGAEPRVHLVVDAEATTATRDALRAAEPAPVAQAPELAQLGKAEPVDWRR